MEWYGVVAVRRGLEVGVPVPGYSAEVYAPPVGRAGQGLLQGARGCVRAPGFSVGALGCYGVWYRVYMLKGPTARCTWRGMMVQSSASRAVRLSPWYIQSVSSSAIFERSLRASRFKMLLWVASVTVMGPVLMSGIRLFWCGAAVRLRAAWRAVLSAEGGAWWVGFLHGVGVTCSGCFHAGREWWCGGLRSG